VPQVPSPARLTFGRCRLCQRPATRRGEDWQHDPGDPCALLVPAQIRLADGSLVDTFVDTEPFDPIRPFWRVEDPRALYLDLPTMPRRAAESAARLLLRRYTSDFDAVGLHYLTDVLRAAEIARLTDDPDLPAFAEPDLSSDYAPGDNDESDVDDEEDGWRPALRQEASGVRRPRRGLLQPTEETPEDPPDEEEWDDSPAPTIP